MFDKLKILVGAIFMYLLGVALAVMFFFMSFADTKAKVLFWVIVAMCFAAGAFLTAMYVKAQKRDSAKTNPADRNRQKLKAARKLNQGDPTGIDVKRTENGDYVFVGKFDLCGMGVFGWDKINISVDEEALKLIYGNDYNDETALKTVTDAIKNFQTLFNEHGHNIVNYFLAQMIEETHNSDNGFWERYRLRSDITDDECSDIFDKWYETRYDGFWERMQGQDLRTALPLDVEAELRANLPFFDIDAFLRGIVPEYLNFTTDTVSIQLSDASGEVFCGAYEEFDSELKPFDWHNF